MDASSIHDDETNAEETNESVPIPFNLILDKSGFSSSSITVHWNPVMDLIALVSPNFVSIYRFMSEWQRLFAFSASESASGSHLSPSSFTTAVWRPDGKVIAAALKSGHIVLYEIENGTQIHVYTPSEENSVVCLHWVENSSSNSENFAENEQFSSQIQRFFGTLEPLASEAAPVQDSGGKSLNVLVAYDSLGRISFRAFGTYVIATLDLCSVTWKRPLEEFDVSKIYLSPNLQTLTVILTSPKNERVLHSQADFDVSILWKNRLEIFELSCQFLEIQRLLDHVLSTYSGISKRWTDGTMLFQKKLDAFTAIPSATEDGSLDDQLFEMLTRGATPGLALEQYLTNTMNEASVKKMRRDLDTATTDLISLFQNHLIKAAEMMFHGLLHVQSLSKWDERYERLNIESIYSEAAIALVASLVARTQGQLLSIVQTSRDLDLFFKWISRIQVKLSEIESDQNAVKAALQAIGPVDDLKVLEFLQAHPLDSLSSVFKDGIDRQAISSGGPPNLMPYPTDSAAPVSGLLETMQDAIVQLFSSPVQMIENSFSLINQTPLFECDSAELARIEFGPDAKAGNWIGFSQKDETSIHLCKIHDLEANQAGTFSRLTLSTTANLLDFAFYTENRLAVLYSDSNEEKGDYVAFGLVNFEGLPEIPLQVVMLEDDDELTGILGPVEMDDPRPPESIRDVPKSSSFVNVSSKRGTGSVWVAPKRILLYDLEAEQEEEEGEEGEDGEGEDGEGDANTTRDANESQNLEQSQTQEEQEEEEENEEIENKENGLNDSSFRTPTRANQSNLSQSLDLGDPIDGSVRRSANNSVSDMSFSSAENISMDLDD